MSFNRWLFTATMIIFLSSSALLAGCGDGAEVSTSTGTVESPPTMTAVPAPAPAPDQPPAEEQASPYGAGTTDDQAVGTFVDGLQLSDVRWSDHGSYFRIVFDMATLEGDPVLQVPHAESSLSPDGLVLEVRLGGIRSLGTNPNAEADTLDIGDSLVSSMNRIQSMDDQLFVYEIHLTRPAVYSLAGLGSPGRIVVDIDKG